MKFFFLLLLSLPLAAYSQIDNLNNKINGLTTIVESRSGNNISQGTGFYYMELDSNIRKDGSRGIKWTFLITNRHVIFQRNIKNKEYMPSSVTIYLRSQADSKSWLPITITRENLTKRIIVFKDSTIDLAGIYVQDLVPKMNVDSSTIQILNAITEQDLPNKQSPSIDVTDDIIVIGYPNRFYDHVNLFPIVKKGIIASKWGANFNGKPYFLIDSKLFKGSSGSLVLSKPSNIAVINGQLASSKEKQYEFLGVYSGTPYINEIDYLGNSQNEPKETNDLGVVWYGYLIKELIYKGILWTP